MANLPDNFSQSAFDAHWRPGSGDSATLTALKNKLSRIDTEIATDPMAAVRLEWHRDTTIAQIRQLERAPMRRMVQEAA
ncbi:hypothetical protein JK208_05285 [Gluconobacter sp. Dm-74]|uniref:hypothetical protein n=1 Tax=Gluconobacter sp. Dm-74 TaxID=2799803 RepID=UPI001B8C45FE|nr:hypothetical protein [Gluconobacter sp. Dm-74]MBS1091018.1 hypothetical protein [Gluconobacter sp. Dm-74]